MTREVTTIITCDECGERTEQVYSHAAEEWNARVGSSYAGIVTTAFLQGSKDLCARCVAKALRERADELDRGTS